MDEFSAQLGFNCLKNVLSHWRAEDTPHADVFYCWSRTHWRLGFDPCNASCGKRSWVALVFDGSGLFGPATCSLREASLCKWIPKYMYSTCWCVPSPIPWSSISTWPGYLLGSTWPVQGFLACTHWMALCSAQISAVFCGVSQSGVPWLGAGDPTNPKKEGGNERAEVRFWIRFSPFSAQTFVPTFQLKLGEKTILWYRWFQMSFYFALIPGENDPVSLIFFNHQLDSNNSTSLTRNHLSPVVHFHDRNCLWWDPFLWFASGVFRLRK